MKTAYPLACAAALCLLAAPALAQTCSKSFDQFGDVSYDLSHLAQATNPYFIAGGDLDCTWDVAEKNYSYYFDFCSNVNAAGKPPPCNGRDGAVLQFNWEEYNCYSAGRSSESTQTLSLIDQSNPALGVQLHYTNGDLCHTNNVYRQTYVNAYCDDTGRKGALNDVAEVGGSKACVYQINFHSPYACPTQCPITGDDRLPCGGNGFCRFDKTNSKARCFCKSGWGGTACDVDLSAGTSGTMIGLLVTILILSILFIGAVVLLYRQVRGYRTDYDRYSRLRGQELVTNESI